MKGWTGQLNKRQKRRYLNNKIKEKREKAKVKYNKGRIENKKAAKEVKLMNKTSDQMKHDLAMRKAANRTLLGTQAIGTIGANVGLGMMDNKDDHNQAVQGGMVDKGQIGRDEESSTGNGPFDKPATEY